jgi:hypothetical protein
MSARRERKAQMSDGIWSDDRPCVDDDKLLQALHLVHTVPREDIAPELKNNKRRDSK